MVKTELRVIYGDTDQMGVVYYANYLRYFEAGRNEFIRAKGLRYRDFEASYRLRLPVAEVGVSYKLPARYDDLVAVETSLVEARRASARFGYRLVRGDDLLATGFTVHACIDLEGRVQRLPRELLDRLSSGEALSGAVSKE
ncbi:acyl-CoA thioesterase [Anaeromyxobacter oryzae]|uniref:Thioesterase n=1 Tax=Anaeromyxobacter oryzae TaxID=2918170 RepID=A0ABM7X3X7_9BACT|nr:thioesterase family protein [Anaeromyxobacter oryzae]BDG06497.1 thioesterase [Anaeromyxobacter oryzae]